MAVAAELTRETQKSFDPLASIHMLQYDLQSFGQVLPETRERVADEELSYLVEGIDRTARTTFVLQRQDGELAYFDKGQWRPYMSLLHAGLQTAEAEAANDPRLSFLAERAAADISYGYNMQSLKPGESTVWYSSFPYEEAARYGDDFVRGQGFVPHRQMGFLYRANCREDGDVILESQTVDQSDEEAFAAAVRTAQEVPEANMDAMVAAYDQILGNKYGGEFFAGRREQAIAENAWTTLLRHKDLIAYLLDELETIAKQEVSGAELEILAKRHVYGVWAAFKKRIDGRTDASSFTAQGLAIMPPLQHEVWRAYHEFAGQGHVLVGCGGAIEILSGEGAIMNASGEDVFGAIFGKSESYSFSKFMYCVSCQAPPGENELKKMCGPCGLCRGCDKKYGGKG